MVKRLFYTNDDMALLVLRLLLGIVYFPHGMQKLLGWFGGYGFSGTMDMFTTKMGIPAILAFLAIIAEGLGPLGLITGFMTRVAAFGIAFEMAVAAYMLHWQNGFFMNWFGNQKGEGFEFHILAIAIGIALMIRGGGKWSIDRAIAASIK
ncbi:MAG TPA: DoxX family protein [Nitrospirota bacterium]|nr:DoxX family protein [Nitrospirota bacterium]